MAIDLCRPFFDKLCQFSGWTPHEAQNEALTAFFNGQRFLAPVFGRRSGKTDVAAHLARYAMGQPNKLIWACAPSYDLCGRLWDFLLPLAKHAFGRALRPRYAKPASMSLPWGTRIEFKSAESPDSMIGAGVDFLIWDEAAPTKNGGIIWQQQLRPTLADKLGQCLMITTPRGHNWFHDLVQGPEWWMKQYPSHCNPYLDRGELAAMEREMDDLVYQQEILAQFVAFVGMVYSMFDMSKHVMEDSKAIEITQNWRTCLACDPGMNTTAILLIKHNPVTGEDVVLRDIELHDKLFEDILRIINEWKPVGGYDALICDVAGKGREQQTGRSFTGWMRNQGYDFQHSGLKDIIDGIIKVRGRLLNMDNQVKLTFAKSAANTVKSMLNYHFPEKKSGSIGEEPVKDGIYDHSADALRYYITWRHMPRTAWKQH